MATCGFMLPGTTAHGRMYRTGVAAISPAVRPVRCRFEEGAVREAVDQQIERAASEANFREPVLQRDTEIGFGVASVMRPRRFPGFPTGKAASSNVHGRDVRSTPKGELAPFPKVVDARLRVVEVFIVRGRSFHQMRVGLEAVGLRDELIGPPIPRNVVSEEEARDLGCGQFLLSRVRVDP